MKATLTTKVAINLEVDHPRSRRTRALNALKTGPHKMGKIVTNWMTVQREGTWIRMSTREAAIKVFVLRPPHAFGIKFVTRSN